MSLHVITSLLALLSYVGLLVLTVHRSLYKHHASRILAAYLFNMIGMQIGYLVISFAVTTSNALLGYTILIPVAAAQPVFYFFFTQIFLHRTVTRKCVIGSFGVWLLVTAFSLVFRDQLIYPVIYRDATTGLFVPEFGDGIPFLGLPSLLFFSLAIINLHQGYRTTRSAFQRIRIQYLLWSITVVIVGFASNFSPSLRAYPMDVSANIVSAALMTYVILRYQLLGIPHIIRTSVLYAVPTLVIGVGYYLIVYLATGISQTLTGRPFFWLSLVVAALAAIIVQPLRNVAQRWIDRAFYREKYDGRLMVERLSRTTTALLDLDILLSAILDEITSTLHITWAGFFLQHEAVPVFHLVAQRGMQPQSTTHLPRDHPLLIQLALRDTVLTMVELLENRDIGAGQDPILTDLEAHKTELLVPLKVEGQISGILVVGPKQSQQSYTYDDELTLMTLANQTAVAINNARLHQLSRHELSERQQAEEKVRDQAEHLRNINDLAIELASLSPDLEIYPYITEKLKTITGALGVSLSIYDAQNKELVIKHVAMRNQFFAITNKILNRSIVGLRMPVSDTLLNEMLAEVVGTKEDLSEMTFGAIPKPLATLIHRAINIGYFMGLSLQYGDMLIGTIVIVMPKQSMPLSENLMRTIAHIAAIALQRRRAADALRQRNRELEMLNRIGREFNSTLELDLVLSNVLEEVRELFDVVASSAWLLDAETGDLVCRQAAGAKSELIVGWRLTAEQGLAGWAIKNSESVIVADAQIDPRYFAAIEKHLQLEFRAIVVVPLRVKENIIGVLEVMDNAVGRFTQDDLTLVESLASTAATAIENARLYEQARLDAVTKTALLKEVNHRVGNNLAAIIGLLNAERRYVSQSNGSMIVPALDRLMQRVQGLSEVHSLLSQSQWAPVRLSDLARQVIRAALNALPAGQQMYVDVTKSSITVSPRQASNLALVINELATNTVKHSLSTRDAGHITFTIDTDTDGRVMCEYRDDGPGFPSPTLNFEHYDVGIYLMRRLVTMALSGELTLANDNGAVTVIRFELEEKDRT